MNKIQVDILGLSINPNSQRAYALLLKEVDGTRRLPIVIGEPEAQAIANELEGVRPQRPMTHDLLKNIIETLGATVREMAAITARALPGFDQKAFIVKALPYEGYLFPDTYRIAKDATSEDIVKIMLSNFDARVDAEMMTEIEKQGRKLHDVMIMASVLDREGQTPEDMALVADLFLRRIKIGIPMQADSTVNYVIAGDKPSITIAQTKIDSPFNTYKYPNLPLGPIGNPGINAIRAAIYPQKNNFLYFLTDAEGNVHYAATFEEHIKNKQKYLP